MGKFYDEIPDFLFSWLPQQELFWVATAPLSGGGHVNVSPKGLKGTFHVESATEVWYEDMTGSGSETIAHLRENGRITLMFSAFAGPPRIARLFGTGTAHEFGSAEYARRVPPHQRAAGSRAVIVVQVHKVGTSCGYAVPYLRHEGPRTLLDTFAASLEARDAAWQAEHPTPVPGDFSERGIKAYWKTKCAESIDGLPAFSCWDAEREVVHVRREGEEGDAQRAEDRFRKQFEKEIAGGKDGGVPWWAEVVGSGGPMLLVGFVAGVAATVAVGQWAESVVQTYSSL